MGQYPLTMKKDVGVGVLGILAGAGLAGYGAFIATHMLWAGLVTIAFGAVAAASGVGLVRGRPWGAYLAMAITLVAAGTNVVLIATRGFSWLHAGAGAACLAGFVSFWLDRPRRRPVDTGAGEEFDGFDRENIGHWIAMAEEDLKDVRPETPFHAVLGRGFMAQREETVQWLAGFHDEVSRRMPVELIYIEMNGFTINPDLWYADGFAFRSLDKGLEDLGFYDACTDEEPLVLRGMEDIQAAYAARHPAQMSDDESLPTHEFEALMAAARVITLRLMQLMLEAHHVAHARGHPVGKVELMANSHDSAMVDACSMMQ